MKKLAAITALTAALVFAFGGAVVAAERGHDFATFDGASPGSGGLCSVTNKTSTALLVDSWGWYVSIANNTAGPLAG